MATFKGLAAGTLVAVMAVAGGCQTSPGRSAATDPVECNHDRTMLTQFVGAWDFEGWHMPRSEPRLTSKGRAAGVIEHQHFVLMDIESQVTQAGSTRQIEGSMLLSVEPGSGPMITAWSEDSPSVRRFAGKIEDEGRRFVFDNFHKGDTGERLRLVLTFTGADQWMAEFTRNGVLAASYTFNRVK